MFYSMQKKCRQNAEASLLDYAKVSLFSLFCCKNIAFFSGRTKNPIEKFYEAIDKIYTSTWVAFKESISLGTAAVISRVTVSSKV